MANIIAKLWENVMPASENLCFKLELKQDLYSLENKQLIFLT